MSHNSNNKKNSRLVNSGYAQIGDWRNIIDHLVTRRKLTNQHVQKSTKQRSRELRNQQAEEVALDKYSKTWSKRIQRYKLTLNANKNNEKDSYLGNFNKIRSMHQSQTPKWANIFFKNQQIIADKRDSHLYLRTHHQSNIRVLTNEEIDLFENSFEDMILHPAQKAAQLLSRQEMMNYLKLNNMKLQCIEPFVDRLWKTMGLTERTTHVHSKKLSSESKESINKIKIPTLDIHRLLIGKYTNESQSARIPLTRRREYHASIPWSARLHKQSQEMSRDTSFVASPNHMHFYDFLVLMALVTQGTVEDWANFCFEFYDYDRNGKLSIHDIFQVVHNGLDQILPRDVGRLSQQLKYEDKEMDREEFLNYFISFKSNWELIQLLQQYFTTISATKQKISHSKSSTNSIHINIPSKFKSFSDMIKYLQNDDIKFLSISETEHVLTLFYHPNRSKERVVHEAIHLLCKLLLNPNELIDSDILAQVLLNLVNGSPTVKLRTFFELLDRDHDNLLGSRDILYCVEASKGVFKKDFDDIFDHYVNRLVVTDSSSTAYITFEDFVLSITRPRTYQSTTDTSTDELIHLVKIDQIKFLKYFQIKS